MIQDSRYYDNVGVFGPWSHDCDFLFGLCAYVNRWRGAFYDRVLYFLHRLSLRLYDIIITTRHWLRPDDSDHLAFGSSIDKREGGAILSAPDDRASLNFHQWKAEVLQSISEIVVAHSEPCRSQQNKHSRTATSHDTLIPLNVSGVSNRCAGLITALTEASPLSSPVDRVE